MAKNLAREYETGLLGDDQIKAKKQKITKQNVCGRDYNKKNQIKPTLSEISREGRSIFTTTEEVVKAIQKQEENKQYKKDMKSQERIAALKSKTEDSETFPRTPYRGKHK